MGVLRLASVNGWSKGEERIADRCVDFSWRTRHVPCPDSHPVGPLFPRAIQMMDGLRHVSAILVFGLLAFAGCDSTHRKTDIFVPWCADGADNLKSRFDSYQHILVARVNEHTWEDLGPNRLTPHHFKATVTTSYKGDWQTSERISFVHRVDSPAPAGSTNNPAGYLVVILTNEHTTNEIALDTGDWTEWREELEPGLEYFYSKRNR